MVLLDLFTAFVKIGFTSFGGLSMIPLISSEMTINGWMTSTEVLDIVAIAEMTPGPLGINAATFAGMRVAGIPGALSATLGVLVPSLTLTMAAAIFLSAFRDNLILKRIMNGVRPVCMGLILATMVSLGRESYFAGSEPIWTGIAIGLVESFIIFRWKPGVPVIIASAAVMGLVFA